MCMVPERNPSNRFPASSGRRGDTGFGSNAGALLFGDVGSPEKPKQRTKQAGESEFVPPVPPLKPTATDLPVDQWGLHRVVSTTHLRGTDRQGAGYYGAPRDDDGKGDGLHNGIDLAVAPGAAILSPATGTVYIGDAYRRGSRRYGKLSRLTVIDPDGRIVNIMYAVPAPGLEDRSRVTAGQVIGYAQDMKQFYGPGMTNHVHVETLIRRADRNVYVDPTPWVRSWSRKPTEGDR